MSKQNMMSPSWGERVQSDLANLDIKSLGRVGVLLGGRSGEREISLMSGNGVLDALLSKGVDAHPFDPGLRSPIELAGEKFDRIFISLHGRYGEDGTIQGLLELLNLPYTGSGVLASALAIDKIATKRIWLSSGLNTPEFMELTAKSDWDAIQTYCNSGPCSQPVIYFRLDANDPGWATVQSTYGTTIMPNGPQGSGSVLVNFAVPMSYLAQYAEAVKPCVVLNNCTSSSP